MKLIKQLPLLLGLIIGSGLLMTSCGSDDPDPSTDLDKEKFIGDYVGEFKCAGLLATVVDDPSLTFSITNTSPEEDDKVKVNLDDLEIPFELVGTVTGNNVSMSETRVEDYTVGAPLNMDIDVTASGNGTISGNSLSSTIDLEGFTQSGVSLGKDKCTITATKQQSTFIPQKNKAQSDYSDWAF